MNVIQAVQIIVATVLVLACLGGLPFGVKPYIVLSGSMEPAIHTGSLAYVDRNIDRESVTVGDIIAYKTPEGHEIVTHRVTENNSEQNHLRTKGDSNDAADPAPVPYERVVGETLFSIPFLGFFFKLLKDHWLLATVFIAAGNLLLALSLRFASRSEKAEKESEHEWKQQQKENQSV